MIDIYEICPTRNDSIQLIINWRQFADERGETSSRNWNTSSCLRHSALIYHDRMTENLQHHWSVMSISGKWTDSLQLGATEITAGMFNSSFCFVSFKNSRLAAWSCDKPLELGRCIPPWTLWLHHSAKFMMQRWHILVSEKTPFATQLSSNV